MRECTLPGLTATAPAAALVPAPPPTPIVGFTRDPTGLLAGTSLSVFPPSHLPEPSEVQMAQRDD